MEKEIWKNIPNYDGYQASNFGNIRSLDRTIIQKNNGVKRRVKGKLLKCSDSLNNGLTVNIYGKTTPIHYLICITFIGERKDNYEICHINGNPKDNRLVNLRYDTKSENQIDMYRQGHKTGQAKLELKDVLKIRELYKEKKIPHRELAKMFNISKTQVGHIVRREQYKWLNDDGTIKETETAIYL